MVNQPSDLAINRLKRLRFRSWHRGCKETDLILGNFSDARLASLSAADLDAFEALLDEDDADVWDWLTAKRAPPRAEYAPLIGELQEYGKFAPPHEGASMPHLRRMGDTPPTPLAARRPLGG